MIKKLNSMDELENEMAKSPILLVYVSGGKCSICTVIKGKIKIMMRKYPEISAVEIDADKNPALAAMLSVFTLPGILMYAEGKEVIREARHISLEVLDERIDRVYKLMLN